MRFSRLLAVVAASLVFVGTASAKAMLPHHKPFHTMSLRQLADYQRLTLKRDGYSIRWWKTHKPSRVVLNARARRFPSCLGARMPRAVCWHYKHRAWTKPLYARTVKQLTLRAGPTNTHYAGWSCITNGAYPGAAHEGNGYNGSYTGWLGMSTPWAGHYPPGSDWVHSDQAAVYAIAEGEAAKHGWSYAWMAGQWPNTFPPCAGFFH